MHNIATFALVALVGVCLQAADVVIVHAGIPDTALSADDLKSAYLGKKPTWSDGARISLVILGGDPGEGFIKERVGRSASQFKAHWKKEVFNGRGTMPAEAADAAGVIKTVTETAGAVGYLPEGQVPNPLPAGIKVLTIN
jgi:ABC-type phosphate transport system substrate-binding protein